MTFPVNTLLLYPLGQLVNKTNLFQIYIQRGKIKDIVIEDPRLEEINRQIDRLIELSDIYEHGWKEYPLLKAEDIYPGETLKF